MAGAAEGPPRFPPSGQPRDSMRAAARNYFPMQKLAKIRPSRSSLVTSPVISPSCF